MKFPRPFKNRVFLAITSLVLVLPSIGNAQPKIHNFDTLKDLQDLKDLQTSLVNLVPKVMSATVCIMGDTNGASGSGVIVNEEGLILTASHVIEGEESVTVLFSDGRQFEAKVLGANRNRDAAMLQLIDAEGDKSWPHVEIGASDDLEVGDFVLALGYSEGFDPVRTPPVRFGRVVSHNALGFFSSDCPLIAGDSGGPLFNLDGEVVGINSSIGQSVMANNHAGLDGFKLDWQKMKDGETWGSLLSNPLQNEESPVVGFGIGEARNGGVFVGEVFENSPADAAGLLRGDLIWKIDGERVTDGVSLLVELNRQLPGQKVSIEVKRGDALLDLLVTLGRRGDFYKR